MWSKQGLTGACPGSASQLSAQGDQHSQQSRGDCACRPRVEAKTSPRSERPSVEDSYQQERSKGLVSRVRACQRSASQLPVQGGHYSLQSRGDCAFQPGATGFQQAETRVLQPALSTHNRGSLIGNKLHSSPLRGRPPADLPGVHSDCQ